jgi:hypothetical protein
MEYGYWMSNRWQSRNRKKRKEQTMRFSIPAEPEQLNPPDGKLMPAEPFTAFLRLRCPTLPTPADIWEI